MGLLVRFLPRRASVAGRIGKIRYRSGLWPQLQGSAGRALRWLKQFGDPYTISIVDPEGRTGIDYGVYGVPETYVIDKNGVIRYKQIGPVTVDALQTKILPAGERTARMSPVLFVQVLP